MAVITSDSLQVPAILELIKNGLTQKVIAGGPPEPLAYSCSPYG